MFKKIENKIKEIAGKINKSNTSNQDEIYNNAKKIRKGDVKEELKGIAKEGIQQVGKQASISNPVAQFAVGAAALALVNKADSKGTNDQQNNANRTTISRKCDCFC